MRHVQPWSTSWLANRGCQAGFAIEDLFEVSLRDFHKPFEKPFYQIHREICAVSALSLAVIVTAHESDGQQEPRPWLGIRTTEGGWAGRRGRKRATDFYCSSRALKSSNWARVATPTGSDVAVTSLHSHARLRRRVQRPARGRGDAGGEGPSHGGRHPSNLRGPPVTVACTPWLVPHHVRSIRCKLFRSNGL